MSRRRKQASVIATLLILAATAVLLVGLVRIWPRLAPPSRTLSRPPATAEAPAGARATYVPEREEITLDERLQLDRILQKRQPTP